MEDLDVDDGRPSSRNGIQVIARAAAVLRALKDNPSGMSLGQIAEKVGLARSTVQRIVQALQEERLVIVSTQAGGVRLGPELHALAGAARYNVADRCRPFLVAMVEETGETVDLSVLRGGRMIFLDQVQGTHRLRTVSSVGEVFPLTTTANGRACLAHLSESEAQTLAQDEWARMGIKGDWPALANILNRARIVGVAMDEDAHTDGISALGIAFADVAGDLYAISVPIPTSRFKDQKDHIKAALVKLKQDLCKTIIG